VVETVVAGPDQFEFVFCVPLVIFFDEAFDVSGFLLLGAHGVELGDVIVEG
jgi:hypothetical protein